MILKELKIKTNLDELTNCYIVHDEESKETMVIDPAGEAEKIIEDQKQEGEKDNDSSL